MVITKLRLTFWVSQQNMKNPISFSVFSVGSVA
jgi:hypothetical protein